MQTNLLPDKVLVPFVYACSENCAYLVLNYARIFRSYILKSLVLQTHLMQQIMVNESLVNWHHYNEWDSYLQKKAKERKVHEKCNKTCAYTYLSGVPSRYNSEISNHGYSFIEYDLCALSLPSPFPNFDFASPCIVLVGLSIDFGVCLVLIQFVLTSSLLPTRYCEYVDDRIKQANSISNTTE